MVLAASTAMAAIRFHRGHRFVGLLFLFVIVVLVVLGIVLIVQLLNKRRQPPLDDSWPTGRSVPSPGHVDPVFNELRMQYARGEIGREEYLRRAADLGYGQAAADGPPPFSSGSSGPPPWSNGPPGSGPPPWSSGSSAPPATGPPTAH
ncbi:MAG: SHOCT domain-containing protein [Acidimicrobiales bacterium]|jgi:putative membrane protein